MIYKWIMGAYCYWALEVYSGMKQRGTSLG